MIESLRDIRLFVAVYEERSFTAAAERENATQSGVSQHIRKIEERFGVRLFERGSGTVTATPAGDSYYRHCIEVLRMNEAAKRAVMSYGAGLDGEIVVGLMPTMTRSVLAPALARFVEVQPNVIVRIVEAFSAVLTQRVQTGELDFAIVPAAPGTVGIKSRLFAQTREVLVSGAKRGLRHMTPVRLADLGPLKIAVPGRQNARRWNLETYWSSNGVIIERLLELDAMLGTLDFVASTDWVTILPGLMMAQDAGSPDARSLVVNPLADPPLGLDLVLIEPARRPLSAAAEAFLDILDEETRRLTAPWQEVQKARSPTAA
ncbi:LysR family transcriptional regulator [Chelatococcus sp. GCM10030263]|uniref:LysR family transcriptional regulator n=1 Tax=Chelatococcus sp. GCM10030263 TaxID=3273387 RepID=UPI00362144D3